MIRSFPATARPMAEEFHRWTKKHMDPDATMVWDRLMPTRKIGPARILIRWDPKKLRSPK